MNRNSYTPSDQKAVASSILQNKEENAHLLTRAFEAMLGEEMVAKKYSVMPEVYLQKTCEYFHTLGKSFVQSQQKICLSSIDNAFTKPAVWIILQSLGLHDASLCKELINHPVHCFFSPVRKFMQQVEDILARKADRELQPIGAKAQPR